MTAERLLVLIRVLDERAELLRQALLVDNTPYIGPYNEWHTSYQIWSMSAWQALQKSADITSAEVEFEEQAYNAWVTSYNGWATRYRNETGDNSILLIAPSPDAGGVIAAGAGTGGAGPGSKTTSQGGPRDLQLYMDEVNDAVHAMDAWVSDIIGKPSTDRLGNGWFATWHSFVDKDPSSRDSRGKPLGWRDFYRDYRGALLPDYLDNWLYGDADLWQMTEQFEQHLIEQYDEAVDAGAKPPIPRPQPKFQKPPPKKNGDPYFKYLALGAIALSAIAIIRVVK